MTLRSRVTWISRRGATCALLALLLLFGWVAQNMAVGKITLFSDIPFVTWPPRLVRHMAGIQFFQAHGWIALPYLLFFFATLVYMEIRSLPRWAVWSAFGCLALPLGGYLTACLRVVAF